MRIGINNDSVVGLFYVPRQRRHCFGNDTNGTEYRRQLHRRIFRDRDSGFRFVISEQPFGWIRQRRRWTIRVVSKRPQNTPKKILIFGHSVENDSTIRDKNTLSSATPKTLIFNNKKGTSCDIPSNQKTTTSPNGLSFR